jgi:flagella basal body P-ring formation protein FlgA
MCHPLCGFSAALLVLLLMIAPPASTSAPSLTDTVQRFLQQRAAAPGAAAPGDEIKAVVYPADAEHGPCLHPRPFLPGNGQRLQGRVTVGVRCGEPGRVRYLQARVSVIGDYWVTRQALAPGTVIEAAMLERKRGDLSDLPRHVIRALDQALGKVTTRPLAAHTVLGARQLRRKPLVERRQNVQVEARGSGFRITREAQALEEGALGDEIRVRMANRHTLTATVAGQGRVVVEY